MNITKHKNKFKQRLNMVRFSGKIKRWGNSYGILLSKQEIERNKFQENQEVIIDMHTHSDVSDLFGTIKFNKKISELTKEIDEGYDNDF